MRKIFGVSLVFLTGCAVFAFGQDDTSLGDVARKARQQSQQKAKDAQGKDGSSAQAAKVFTNEEIPEHSSSVASNIASDQLRRPGASAASGGAKMSAERWKSRIQSQKTMIASLQSEIDKLNDSIHFAPVNCVADCAQWNQRQRQKQQGVERLQAQLEDQKKRLEDMQETARQQGYGSSVYDP